ncbi:MAG: hypothetical protein WD767_14365 [Alphaproteobacteria bacterium]
MLHSRTIFYCSQFMKLAEVIGFHATNLLCQRFGGVEDVRVPADAGKNCDLRDVVGNENFEKLVAVMAGQKIDIPLPPRETAKKSQIVDDLLRGEYSVLEIARRSGVTMRYVRHIRSYLRSFDVDIPAQPPSASPSSDRS